MFDIETLFKLFWIPLKKRNLTISKDIWNSLNLCNMPTRVKSLKATLKRPVKWKVSNLKISSCFRTAKHKCIAIKNFQIETGMESMFQMNYKIRGDFIFGCNREKHGIFRVKEAF